MNSIKGINEYYRRLEEKLSEFEHLHVKIIGAYLHDKSASESLKVRYREVAKTLIFFNIEEPPFSLLLPNLWNQPFNTWPKNNYLILDVPSQQSNKPLQCTKCKGDLFQLGEREFCKTCRYYR